MNQSLSQRRAAVLSIAVASSILGWSSPAFSQVGYPASDPLAVFAPDEFVPLSEYAIAQQGTTVTLSVHPDILAWASSTLPPSIKIARQLITVGDTEDGPFQLKNPTAIDVVGGTVSFTAARTSRIVVVSTGLRNDFPIVTHWDASANPDGGYDDPNIPNVPGVEPPPRGGQSPDATDGIGRMEFTTSAASPSVPTLHLSGGGAIYAEPSEDHRVDGHRAYFATHRYALFSDGTETTPAKDGELGDADVPTYERYIGENWSTAAVSKRAAARLSDLSRASTGWPIAHRNPTPAFGTPAAGEEPLSENYPIMQLVHAKITGLDRVETFGREDNLASILVPPSWVKNPLPGSEYAVLFGAGYDIHVTMFRPDNEFLEPIGALHNGGLRAITVLTNGGGAICSLSQQVSAYENHEKLFDFIEAELGGDRTRVVATGASRGATAALAMAAGYVDPTNPAIEFHPFEAVYVNAFVPTAYPGKAWRDNTNSTYPLIQASAQIYSGLLDGWRPEECFDSFLDEVVPGATAATGVSGAFLSAESMFGTGDYDYIDENLGNGAPELVRRLAEKGTKVKLGMTTHDYTRSVIDLPRYHEALLEVVDVNGNPYLDGSVVPPAPLGPIETSVAVSYRAGHGGIGGGTGPTLIEMLAEAAGGPMAPFSVAVSHFNNATDADEASLNGQELIPNSGTSPTSLPMVMECPRFVALGQDHTLAVAGPQRTAFVVQAVPIDWGIASPPDPTVNTPAIVLDVQGTTPTFGYLLDPQTMTVWHFDGVTYEDCLQPGGGSCTAVAAGTAFMYNRAEQTLLPNLFEVLPDVASGAALSGLEVNIAPPSDTALAGGWMYVLGFVPEGQSTLYSVGSESSTPAPPLGSPTYQLGPLVYWGNPFSSTATGDACLDAAATGDFFPALDLLPDVFQHARSSGISTDRLFDNL